MLKQLRTSEKLASLKNQYPNGHLAVVLIAIIMIWRGVWGFLDTVLFPGQPLLSYSISIVLGAAVLYCDGFNLDNLKR